MIGQGPGPRGADGLEFRDVGVQDQYGVRARASMACCTACADRDPSGKPCGTFLVYLIGGLKAHLQCSRCGASYCYHEGPCS